MDTIAKTGSIANIQAQAEKAFKVARVKKVDLLLIMPPSLDDYSSSQ